MKEVVSFFLSGKEYGVEVSNMQGIENYEEAKQLPGLPECLTGILTIRGDMIPVMNIRKRLVLPPVPVTKETKYLLFRTVYGRLACVVDGVSKIFKAEGDDVQTFPVLMQTEATDYVDFVAKDEGGLVVVIDPGHLLSEEEWIEIHRMIEAEKEARKAEELKKAEEARKAEEAKKAEKMEEEND